MAVLTERLQIVVPVVTWSMVQVRDGEHDPHFANLPRGEPSILNLAIGRAPLCKARFVTPPAANKSRPPAGETQHFGMIRNPALFTAVPSAHEDPRPDDGFPMFTVEVFKVWIDRQN